ncbi:uncharacterized protein LOC135846578 [Planococcus citri]|uniref:uncharacterized protein LOC135846578 n=1 Tax=Planococcus citri TaxID=170843 RepID=UPI0031FA3CFC
MPNITEMLCMFCLRSVTTTSPVCEKDDTVKEYISISRCRHLMHMSCFVFAHPADPVTCRHPKCAQVINCNQVDVIEANLRDRTIVENLEEKSNRVDELTAHLTQATCNLELITRLKVAEDKIAELEANAEHHAELMVEAEKRTSEAKAAELDATKRYDAAEDKIAQLELLVKDADKRASEAKAAELKKAQKRYNAAKDKIAQLEEDSKHNAELVAEANKRTSEAKAAELDAEKRYNAADDKIAQLEANAKKNAELLSEANKRASEAKAAELDAEKRYNAAEDKIAQLEANAKKNAELLAEAEKRASEAKAAELDAKHYSELVIDAINKRASESKEAELKAKKRYDTAQDSIAQLEANAEHNSDLVAEANKRTSKAKAAELDATKRYKLVLGKLSSLVIACRCTASSDFSVLISKDCNSVPLFPPNVELSPPGPTSPIAPISGSNNVLELDQNPEVVRADSPNRECLTMESIADFPNALADYTPMSPPDGDDTSLLFSESIDIADKAGASRPSRSAGTSTSSYRRKMTSQIIAQEDGSPAAKRWKGASESSTRDYEKYWQRFHITPPKLNPFFPVNSFPMGYTVADIQDTENVGKVAILAYDVLLLGDGHSLGVANYILKGKPFKDQLSESLYRRDLGIVDLIATLNRFAALPERIILSIGSWDATNNMPCSKFLDHFEDLLLIFMKCQVKVLYTLPIITYPGMDENRKSIDESLSTDWGKTFGGQYEFLSEMVSSAINVQLPVIDDKGPVYELDEYASLAAAIRNRLIPVAAVETTLPTKDAEETNASLSSPSGRQS